MQGGAGMEGAGGRRTWAAAGSLHLKETEGKNEALSAQGVDPSYREYLAVLQEKNRILKELRKKEEDRLAAITERERGFDLNFAGANEERIRRKKESEKTATGRAPRAGSAGARHRAASDISATRNRSTWHKGSVHIQTMRGSMVRLAPPSCEQTRESMQWLVSEEGRSWLDSDDGQNWLESREAGVAGHGTDGDGDGQSEGNQVDNALALVKATLKYNGLSIEDGFAEFDSDNDGRITLQDIDDVVKSLAMELSESDTRMMFALLDRDGDGFVEPLDWIEALTAVDSTAELAARGLDIASPNKGPPDSGRYVGAEEEPAAENREDTVEAAGADPCPVALAKDNAHKKKIVSPVGQYIKTGELPVARVRGSTSSMGTIRESIESPVASPAKPRRTNRHASSPGRSSAVVAGGIAEGGEEEYEDDFDELEEDEDDEDLYGYGESEVYGVDRRSGWDSNSCSLGATGAADAAQLASMSEAGRTSGDDRSERHYNRVGSRPVSARCSDALDFERRMLGLEEEEIAEEEAAAGDETDGGRGEREEGDAEVDDEIVEVMGSDDEEETGQVFEAAARAAYSRWADDQPTKLKHASAGAHTRVLSASQVGRPERTVVLGVARRATSAQVHSQVQAASFSSPLAAIPGGACGVAAGAGPVEDMGAVLSARQKETSEAVHWERGSAGEGSAAGGSHGGRVGGSRALRPFPWMPSAKSPASAVSAGGSGGGELLVGFGGSSGGEGGGGGSGGERMVQAGGGGSGVEKDGKDLVSRDERKQSMLLSMLDDIEFAAIGDGAHVPQGRMEAKIEGSRLGAPKSARRYPEDQGDEDGGGAKRVEVGEETGDGAAGAGVEESAISPVPAQAPNELVVEVLGNWGHDRMVGLTHVELFDSEGARVRLANAQVCSRGFRSATDRSHLLINKKALTTNEADMWSSYLPASNTPPPALVFFLPDDVRVGAVRLWNYNKSLLEASKGVRQARVVWRGVEVWTGEVNKGSGDLVSDYTTTIFVPAGHAGGGEPGEMGVDLSMDRLPPLPFETPPPMDKQWQTRCAVDEIQGEMKEAERKEDDTNAPGESNGRGSAASGPLWLQRGLASGHGLDSPSSNSGSLGRGRSMYNLEDPDMLPAGLAASRQRQAFGRDRSALPAQGLAGFDMPEVGGGAGTLGDVEKPGRLDGTIKAGRRKGRKHADVEKSLDSLSLFRRSHMGRLGLFDDDDHSSDCAAKVTAPRTAQGQENEQEDMQSSVTLQHGVQEQVVEEVGDPRHSVAFDTSTSSMIFSSTSFVAEEGGPSSVPQGTHEQPNPISIEAGRDRASQSDFFLSPLHDDDTEHGKGEPVAGTGSSAEVGIMSKRQEARGLLVLVRELQRRGLLSTEEGDTFFQRIDQGETAVMALDERVREQPPALENEAECQALVRQLREMLPRTHDPQMKSSEETAGSGVKREALHQDEPEQAEAVGDTVSPALVQPGVAPVTEGFVIPERPRGRLLRMFIWSTWGDVYYVGLNGVEVFDGSGEPVVLEDVLRQVSADPPDINVLEGYGDDPRTVDNLMDGVNNTCDDLNMWLAPFTQGQTNSVSIDLGREIEVSMIRIWNYNKSRIHAARGVRLVELFLDDACIFTGELACAPGNLIDAEDRAEVLLFTQDEPTLAALATSLDTLRHEAQAEAVERNVSLDGGDDKDAEMASLTASLDEALAAVRPSTPGDGQASEAQALADRSEGGVAGVGSGAAGDSEVGVKGREVEILLEDTWGDKNYVGLTGLQVVLRGGAVLPLTDSDVTASPRDLNEIPGNSGDPRTKDKLVNNINITCDDRNMWLVPYTAGGTHRLVLSLGEAPVEVMAIRLWNYNKTPEDTTRGAKTIRIHVDGVAVTPSTGVTLRKAPGNATFDFGHTIALGRFSGGTSGAPALWSLPAMACERPVVLERLIGQCRQDFDPPALPRGLTLCVSLTATHGDLYYIGLNAIALFDESGAAIRVRPEQLIAVPASINELDGVSNDCRTPDKLIDGSTSTWDATRMWLAPYTRGTPNNIYIVFSEPVTLSMIKIWNYARTPSRGASEAFIWLDGALVFAGYLLPAPPAPPGGGEADARTGTSGEETACFGQAILLHATPALLAAERRRVVCSAGEQHCLLINERKVVEGQSIVHQERQSAASGMQHAGAGGAGAGMMLPAGARPSTSIPHRH